MPAQPAAVQPARARIPGRSAQRAYLPRALSSGRDLPGRPGTRGGRECAPFLPRDPQSSRSSPRDDRLPPAPRHPAPQPRRRAPSGSGCVARPGAVGAPALTPHRHSPPQGGPHSGPGPTPGGPGGAGPQVRARGPWGCSVARGVSPPSFGGAERSAGPASGRPPKTDISNSLNLALY